MLTNNKLQIYLDKLGLKDKQELSLEFIEKLQTAHISSFTFNNIDVLLDKPIPIETNNIFEKMVVQNRGGYCFEHNGLMHDVLKALGFDVRMILARVTMNENGDSERGHRITLLQFGGEEYIVDVGFTAESQSHPIKIGDNTRTKEYRVIKDDGVYRFQIFKDKEFFTFYTYTLEQYTQADCKVSNFYSYQHQDAVFKNVFALSRITTETTYSLRNRNYYIISKNSTTIKKVKNIKEFETIFIKDFKLNIDSKTISLLWRKSLDFEN